MPSRILIPPVVRLLCHTLPVGCALSVAKICEGHTREVAEEAIRTVCDVRKQCWECQQPIDAPFVSRDSPIIPVESDDDGFSDLYLENESSVVSKSSTEQEQFEKRLEIAERVPSVVFETSDPPGLFCGECAERFRLPSEMDESDMLLLSRLTTDWDEYQNALDPHSRSSLYCRLVSVDEASCKVAPMPVLFAHGKRVVDMDVFRPLSKNYLTTMDQLTAAARENLPQIIDMALGVGFWQYFAALCFPPHQVSKDADLNIVNRAVALKIAAPVRALEARVASVSALKCIISSILFELGRLQQLTRHPQFIRWSNFVEKFLWDYDIQSDLRPELEARFLDLYCDLIYDGDRPILFNADTEMARRRIVKQFKSFSAREVPCMPRQYWLAPSMQRILERRISKR
ncbi:MAG: hypothetical protein KVP17_001493 [Porospora cf. gigantea B]|uniref:uncharacterized protein n=1 Tax=Porospora cf. gigantea B TaxID=2853592 RepID=UPI003571C414|nr:MAG: hypothetical protein KVP17_001493 [Porospora cf. gigantea B]